MPSPLFSTYRAGENRVTSSTIAVFERLDLAIVQELLEKASGIGEELRSVTFTNQVMNDGSVPDARISARFTWWFETKTTRGGYTSEGHDRDQLRSHSKLLHDDPDAILFVLTPDPVQSAWFDVLDGVEVSVQDQIVWLSFLSLADAIHALLAESTRLIGEQTRFLLTELVALFEADGLLTNDDTVVVAARAAWGEYLEYAAYVCQADRSFREGLTHFGFYYKAHIQATVPRIVEWLPNVVFTKDVAAWHAAKGNEALATVIRRMLADGVRADGDPHGVILLTPWDDPQHRSPRCTHRQRHENRNRQDLGVDVGPALHQIRAPSTRRGSHLAAMTARHIACRPPRSTRRIRCVAFIEAIPSLPVRSPFPPTDKEPTLIGSSVNRPR